MSDREVREPGAEHPLDIAPTRKRVTVHVNGEMVADTFQALTVREANYPEVQYIPFEDLVDQMLVRTDTSTYCPYKGDANYYSVKTEAGAVVQDVIWTYERPHAAAGAIARYVAFYPDKATVTVDGTVFDGDAPTCECQLGD
jgi:uncharacterized protein (DUF427 family)